jgi:hypothetical protein
VIAEIFREQFFVPIWSREASLNRYSRNWRAPLSEYFYYLIDRGYLRKKGFLCAVSVNSDG